MRWWNCDASLMVRLEVKKARFFFCCGELDDDIFEANAVRLEVRLEVETHEARPLSLRARRHSVPRRRST